MIDVVITTLESEHKLHDCLASVLRELPVNRIILVDGGSKDRTVEIARSFEKVVVFVRPDLTRIESIKFGADQVSTEWFLQIDSDVVLRSGWFQMAEPHLSKADAIEFGTCDHFAFDTPPDPAASSSELYQRGRAMLFNVLIRRDVVRNLDFGLAGLYPDEALRKKIGHAWDDEWLRVEIERHGGRWWKAGVVASDHFSSPVRFGRQGPLLAWFKATPYPDWFYESKGFVDGVRGLSGSEKIARIRELMRWLTDPLRVAWRACRRNPFKVVRAYLRGVSRGRAFREVQRSKS